jgi:hypothetical protein
LKKAPRCGVSSYAVAKVEDKLPKKKKKNPPISVSRGTVSLHFAIMKDGNINL